MLEICEGNPITVGAYVAYVNDDLVTRFAKRTLLFWDGQRWGYPMSDQRFRGHVYQWIGPLPALKLEE